MPRNHRPRGAPAILCTPTKQKAIVLYHDSLGKSFNWIAKKAPEFENTKTTHVTISRNYKVAKREGCYAYGDHPGRPLRFSAEEMDEAVELIDSGRVTD